jgi:hypothetical protein
MSTFDAIAMGVAIIGFLATLAGAVAVLNRIVVDLLAHFERERAQREIARRCEPVSGRPEFFRPQHARNRWL